VRVSRIRQHRRVFQLILPFQLDLPFDEPLSVPTERVESRDPTGPGKRRRPRVRMEDEPSDDERFAV
jgi:hypothetical protein